MNTARQSGRAAWVVKKWAPLSLVLGASAWAVGCHGSEVVANLPNIKITYEEPPPPPPPVEQPAPPPPPPLDQHAPDPRATLTREQFRLHLQFKGGQLHLQSAQAVTLKAVEPTPRKIGRFAAELWVGQELLDRVRFEVPLLGADTNDDSFEHGIDVALTVMIPNHPRASRLVLVDRKTQKVTEYPFPPAPLGTDWEDAPAPRGSGGAATGTGGMSGGEPLGGAALGTGGASSVR